MNSSCFVHYSNHFELLYEMLRDQLYAFDSQLFAPRRIVVPSGAVKEWLQRQFAFDPKVGVAAGLTFLTLDQAAGLSLPSELEIALALEAKGVDPKTTWRLARHFLDYFFYGQEMVASWSKDWQADLWSALFSDRERREGPQEGLHLFGFSHLAPRHLEIFSRLGAHLYLLSPTPLYWGDLLSDREAASAWRREERRGLSESALDEMSDFLLDRHPLLANLGRLGRSLVSSLADAAQVEERFEEKERSLLIHSVQADLFDLECRPAEPDRSIELVGAGSKWGEVVALRSRVIEWLEEEPNRSPSEILVLAPNIADYLPYVEALFDGLPFYCAEGKTLLSPLSMLLKLATSRWESTCFLDLIEQLSLFCSQEIEQIRKWIIEADIRWGENASHRSNLLEQEHTDQALTSSVATWESGFARLLEGLASGRVEMSQADLLGRWIDLFYQLREDLDVKLRTPKEWASWLSHLATTYTDQEIPWAQELARIDLDHPFSLTSITPWLDKRVARRCGSADDLGAIRLSSIAPMQVVPAQFVCLLGMEEGSLPRPNRISPLDRLRQEGIATPTPGDRDRYFFLEAILSAREKLLLTYCNRSKEEGTQQSPSLLVQELLAHYPIETQQIPDEPPRRELPPIDLPTIQPSKISRLTLSDLRTAVQRPCRLYFRDQLHFSLEEEEGLVDEEDFSLPYRQLEQLVRQSFAEPLERLLDGARERGILPGGSLGSVGRRWLIERVARITAGLEKLEIDPQSGFWIDLCPATTRPEPLEGGVRLPSLQVEGVELVGRLWWTFPSGLPVVGKPDAARRFKRWPDLLIHRAVGQRGDLDLEPALLFLDGGKIEMVEGDPFSQLAEMIDYTLRCTREPSPVHPSWGEPLARGEWNRVEKALPDLIDPYLHWLLPQIDLEALATQWQGPLSRLGVFG